MKMILFISLILLACMAQISSDIYTPSIPAIAYHFEVALSHVQQSLAVFMLGLVLTVLIYGPLSEGIGRKKTLLIGMTIGVVGALISLFAGSILLFLLGRFVQGLGIGACASLWRSIFRDSFTGPEISKYSSYLTNASIFSVIGAPFIGGLVQQFLNWRVNFLILLLYILVTFLFLAWKFKETSQYHHKSRLKLSFILSSYWEIISHRSFLCYSSAVFLCYGAVFSWLSISPVLVIKHLQHSPALYGSLNVCMGCVLFLASVFNAKWVAKLGMKKMLSIGFCIMFVAALVMVLNVLLFGLTLLGLLIPFVMFTFGVTLIWPNAFSSAFTPFGHIAGYAGAMYSFIQLMGGVVFGFLVPHLPNDTQLPLACVLLFATVLAWVLSRIA